MQPRDIAVEPIGEGGESEDRDAPEPFVIFDEDKEDDAEPKPGNG